MKNKLGNDSRQFELALINSTLAFPLNETPCCQIKEDFEIVSLFESL